MASKNEVTIDITGKDKASPAIKSVTGGIEKIGKIAATAGLAVAGAMTGMVVQAAKFDTKMREVNTMLGLSQEEFKALGNKVKDLSSDVGIAAGEISGALYQVVSAGYEASDAIDLLGTASKAAIAGVTDVETAADGLTSVLNAFKIPASEVEKVADIMFTTVKRGKTTFQELASSLYNVSPIAATAGVSFEEVSAALATVTKQGVPTSVATTQLRAAIQSIIKPTDDMSIAIQNAGYSSGEAMIAEQGFAGAINTIRDSAGDSLENLGSMTGSVESLSAMMALTGENAATFSEDLIATTQEAAGAVEAAYTEMNEGIGRQFDTLMNDIKLGGIEIGESLLPIFDNIIEDLKPIAAGFGDWAEKHPKLIENVTKLAFALVGFGGLVYAVKAITSAITGVNMALAIFHGLSGLGWAKLIAGLAVGAAGIAGINYLMGQLGETQEAVGGAVQLSSGAFRPPNAPGYPTSSSGSVEVSSGVYRPPSMDSGGIVPGKYGTVVPVLARAGEHFGGFPPRGGVNEEHYHFHVGAFMGKPEDARKFADMISEAQRKNNRRTVGRLA